MKSAAKTTKFLLVLFAIILGIVIVVNLFLPGTLPQLEGFKEGNRGRVTDTAQTCNKTSCTKSHSNIDKWFKNKTIDDVKGFFNVSTGTMLRNAKLPFSVDRKDNCTNYIQCKVNALQNTSQPTDTTATASATPTATSAATATSSTDIANRLSRIEEKLDDIAK